MVPKCLRGLHPTQTIAIGAVSHAACVIKRKTIDNGQDGYGTLRCDQCIEEAIYLADRIAVITPRPAKVDQLIEVPFERPRNESMKSLPAFLELRGEIWKKLKEGIEV